MIMRSRFSQHDPNLYAIHTPEESRTQQQFKSECDINNILKKYQQTSLLTHVNRSEGKYGDFTNVTDYQTALDKLMSAQDTFNSLPSSIRKRFQNDPALLIEFVNDDKNRNEAIELGLIEKKVEMPTIKDQMIEALEINDQKRSKTK